MSLFILNSELLFPPQELAEPDGLLAVGGDLSRKGCCLAIARVSFPGMKAATSSGGAPTPVSYSSRRN